MWYVCDIMYVVLYIRISCFAVRVCVVARRPPAVCKLSARTVVKLCICWCVIYKGGLGFPNCDDIYMCVVDKQFELLEFLFDFVYVEISLTFTAGFVSLCCVCSHVVVFGLSVSVS